VEPAVPEVVSDRGVATSSESLFAAHFADVVRLAALLGADDPEDVAQEAFVRLHRAHHRLRDASAALTYVRRTAVNLCRSRLRRLRVARAYQPPVVEVASAEAHALNRETVREVVEALTRISRRQREVLVLRYWLDLTEPQIAELLGLSVGGVKSNTFRAMESMRRELGDRR
jgi:RNA polymerase sigma factor (sigma-70 family)